MKKNIEQLNKQFKYVTMCINAFLHIVKNNDYGNIIDICFEVTKNILEFKKSHSEYINKIEEEKKNLNLDVKIFNIFDIVSDTTTDDYQFQIYIEKIIREFKMEFENDDMKSNLERDFQTMGMNCIQIYIQKFLSKVTNVRIKINSHAEYLERTNKMDDDCIKKIIMEQNKLVINYSKYISYLDQYIYLNKNKNNIEKCELILKNIIRKKNISELNCKKNINHITNTIYLLIKSKPYFIFDILFEISKQMSNNWMGFLMKFYNEGLAIMKLYNL